jgi:glycosyltransferase involved in cell wall biosynthesis
MIKYIKKSVNQTNLIRPVEINCDYAIRYVGQSGTSGYASAAKGYIANFILNGTTISWKPLLFDDSRNDRSYYVDVLSESVINKKINKFKKQIIHCTPDIWMDYIDKNIEDTVGYCTWETNKLPDSWVKFINNIPQVWVPSEFNRECFIDSGVKSSIHVVPHVWHSQLLMNKSDIKMYDYTRKMIPTDKFTFYSIGELNYRKGIEDVIELFDRFHDQFEDTQLVLKLHYRTYDSIDKERCIQKINSLTKKLGTSIYLILDNLTRDEIVAIHSFGDCYVSLNKGEGFGLTIFDAYNFNKKIITTGYGGQLDYLGKNYNGLVNFKLNNVRGMSNFNNNYNEDQIWAYPDLDHAYELMKMFYENKL